MKTFYTNSNALGLAEAHVIQLTLVHTLMKYMLKHLITLTHMHIQARIKHTHYFIVSPYYHSL